MVFGLGSSLQLRHPQAFFCTAAQKVQGHQVAGGHQIKAADWLKAIPMRGGRIGYFHSYPMVVAEASEAVVSDAVVTRVLPTQWQGGLPFQ